MQTATTVKTECLVYLWLAAAEQPVRICLSLPSTNVCQSITAMQRSQRVLYLQLL